jgi:hypothetical protein
MVLGFLSLILVKEGAGNGLFGSQTRETYKKNVVLCTGSYVREHYI